MKFLNVLKENKIRLDEVTLRTIVANIEGNPNFNLNNIPSEKLKTTSLKKIILNFYNRVYSEIVFIERHFNIYLQNKVHNIKSDNSLSDAQTYTNCRLVFFNLLFVCL